MMHICLLHASVVDEGLREGTCDLGFGEVVPSTAVALDFVGGGMRDEEDGPLFAAPEGGGLEGGRWHGGFGDEGVVVEEGGWDAEDRGVGAVVAN
jgi:hypothetical protein